MKTKLLYSLFLISSFCFGGGGGIGGAATEVTQMMNNAQLVKQYDTLTSSLSAQLNQLQQQIAQVQMMKQNLLMLSPTEWNKFASQALALQNVIRQGQAVTFAAANLDAQFAKNYVGYDNWFQNANTPSGGQSFRKQYQQMNNATRDNINGVLKALQLQMNDLQSDEQTLNALQAQGRSAEGQLKVIQATNEIAVYQVNTLKKLHYTLALQANAQADYIAHKNEVESASNAASSAWRDNSVKPDPNSAPSGSKWRNSWGVGH